MFVVWGITASLWPSGWAIWLPSNQSWPPPSSSSSRRWIHNDVIVNIQVTWPSSYHCDMWLCSFTHTHTHTHTCTHGGGGGPRSNSERNAILSWFRSLNQLFKMSIIIQNCRSLCFSPAPSYNSLYVGIIIIVFISPRLACLPHPPPPPVGPVSSSTPHYTLPASCSVAGETTL